MLLAVTDTGCGMDAETLERIFEPFFTTKEEGRGTGLGLSTVYGIVKQSGGYIFADSRPGRDDLQSLSCPARRKRSPRRRVRAEKDECRGDETILVVEDDQAVRDLTERMLTSAGYSVVSAESGEQALRVCEERSQDIVLVVTDVVMPHIGGRELADLLRSKRPEVRILYMSGYSDETITDQGVLGQGDDFVIKPFGREQLLRAVRQALDRRS